MTNLIERVKSTRLQDEKYEQVKETMFPKGNDKEFHIIEDVLIRFNDKIYVHNSNEIRRWIMNKYQINKD